MVVPAYNEEIRLQASLPLLAAALDWGDDAELIIVDDGSEDRTSEVAGDLLADVPGARVLRGPHTGKGAAVRRGVLAARGARIAFMDADLATDLGDLSELIAGLDEADVVVGSRVLADAMMTGLGLRRGVLHNAYRWHARRWGGVGVSDPQCGFKAFRRPAAKVLFSRTAVTGFAFDVEILMLARVLGLTIAEIPVRWHAVEGSRVRVVRDSTAMLTDLVRVRMRHAAGIRVAPLADLEL